MWDLDFHRIKFANFSHMAIDIEPASVMNAELSSLRASMIFLINTVWDQLVIEEESLGGLVYRAQGLVLGEKNEK